MLKRTAFTLIELLVVIAIIAILAAILFPVFARARENARKASCMSNMKQIGLGIMQYTQDYDEKFPMRYYGTAGTYEKQQAGSWRRTIFPYVKSTQLFSCPSNSLNGQRGDDSTDAVVTGAPLPADTPRFNRSYAINGANSFDGKPPSEYATSANLAEMVNSAEIILVAEFSQGRVFTGDINLDEWGKADYSFKGHMGTCNWLFCDGHVKAMKPLATAQPKNLWSCEDDGPITTGDGFTRITNWQKLVQAS